MSAYVCVVQCCVRRTNTVVVLAAAAGLRGADATSAYLAPHPPLAVVANKDDGLGLLLEAVQVGACRWHMWAEWGA